MIRDRCDEIGWNFLLELLYQVMVSGIEEDGLSSEENFCRAYSVPIPGNWTSSVEYSKEEKCRRKKEANCQFSFTKQKSIHRLFQ